MDLPAADLSCWIVDDSTRNLDLERFSFLGFICIKKHAGLHFGVKHFGQLLGLLIIIWQKKESHTRQIGEAGYIP